MADCIFCKIIKGDIPCHKVWETNDFLCFLDIDPVSKGHSLIITKEHYPSMTDVPDNLLREMSVKIKETANSAKEKLGANTYNICVVGEDVDHVHFHVIPRYDNDDAKFVFGSSTNPENKEFDTILKELKN